MARGKEGSLDDSEAQAAVNGVVWPALIEDLNAFGSGETTQLLVPAQCEAIVGLYEQVDRFRSTVDMARYRFGSGQYRYFDYPLPSLVAALRAAFW